MLKVLIKQRLTSPEQEAILPAECLWTPTASLPWVSSLSQPTLSILHLPNLHDCGSQILNINLSLCIYVYIYLWGFPGGSVVKNSPANSGDVVGLIPKSVRSPRVGNGNPLQYSCLANPMDRGAW